MIATLDARLQSLSDRLDPMLVRCVRQDLRSKVFVGVFSLLLLISAAAALIFATNAGASGDADRTYGRELFIVLAWCWSFALIVVQASATHRLVAQERNDDTWDLVELTGLPPKRIVRGLLIASLTQSALYTAAMAPFLVMAYLLRGLDLLTIAAALISVPMLGVLAAAISLFLACAAPNRRARMAGGGLVGLVMVIGWISTSALQFNSWDRGLAQILRSLATGEWEAWLGLGIAVNAWAGLVWMFLVLATTLLTHRAEDRSSRPRLVFGLLWLNAIAWSVIGILAASLDRGDVEEVFVVLGIAGAFVALVGGFFSITEDRELTPRQARSIAESHGWRRRVSPLLGPGAARGRWFLLALAATAGALLASAFGSSSQVIQAAALGWFTLGYGMAVLVIGDWLARVPFGRWCSQPVHRRLVVLALASGWSILPPLAALVVGDEGALYPLLRFLTPEWAVYQYAFEDQESVGAMVLFVLPLAMALVLAVQATRYRTTVTRRVVADAGDRNPRS